MEGERNVQPDHFSNTIASKELIVYSSHTTSTFMVTRGQRATQPHHLSNTIAGPRTRTSLPHFHFYGINPFLFTFNYSLFTLNLHLRYKHISQCDHSVVHRLEHFLSWIACGNGRQIERYRGPAKFLEEDFKASRRYQQQRLRRIGD